MTQISWPWAGTTVGDATYAAYTDTFFSDFFQLFLAYDRTKEGVVDTGYAGLTGGLALSLGAGDISIATGVGIVDGRMLKNDAAVALVPDNTASQRRDRVVMRADYAAQTVRLYLIKGTDGSLATPTLTQDTTRTTYWDISLGYFDVAPGPVLSNLVRDAVAVRTPLGPGYQSDVLTADDLTFTANAWNDIIAGGDTLQVSLGPGKWAIWGFADIERSSAAGTRFIRLYNSTGGAVLAVSAISLAAADIIRGTVSVGPVVVDLGANSTVKLQFYALEVNDVVYGGTTQPAISDSLDTMMYAQRVV